MEFLRRTGNKIAVQRKTADGDREVIIYSR